jgi:DNA mismatch repair protein MutS2
LRRAAENQAAELRQKSAKLRRKPELAPASQQDRVDEPCDASEISEGDHVKIQSFDREGIVEAIREGTYVVVVGSLRYRANRSDLKRVSGGPPPAPPESEHSLIVDAAADVVSELKVIGMTADEAVDRVDKFLDQAFLAGVESVRIIHGHGKGILRNAIAELLTGHPQVEQFRPAPPEKGGSGATVVELRK